MRLRILVSLLALAWALPAQAQQCLPQRGEPGRFDYFLLSLSWSPAFCTANRGRATEEQCGQPGRFGFIVHGLWPQFTNGSWPQCCSSVPPLRPSPVVDELAKVMPGQGLRRHQWEKHGSCVTDRQDEYFGRIMRVVANHGIGPTAQEMSGQRVSLTRLKQFWPSLPPSSLSPTCERGELAEMRICLSPSLNPIACPIAVRDDDNCPGTVSLR